MVNAKNRCDLELTVIITVVSGKDSMRHCLQALYPQVDFTNSEVIVPYDEWSEDICELSLEFPKIRFHFIEELAMAEDSDISAHSHRLYDRRRAVGLRLAGGQIIAVTEDHALPAADWVEQILLAHKQPYEVIGGAIENGIDRPLNWAWYYCDFGRYGRPFDSGEKDYVSDVNVSYKKKTLDSVREVWHQAYSETVVHWTLQERGTKLFLHQGPVVYQNRSKVSLSSALRERINWGRSFAETRVAVCSFVQRFMYIFGVVVLPPLLLFRVLRNMNRQKRTIKQIIQILPLALLLLIGWSLGELIGYVSGLPVSSKKHSSAKLETSFVIEEE